MKQKSPDEFNHRLINQDDEKRNKEKTKDQARDPMNSVTS
jgi:hypothetical protein